MPAQVVPLLHDEPLLKSFACGHLRPDLRGIAMPFGELAVHIVATLPRSLERTVALRKLVESRDAALRAAELKGGS